MCDLLDVLYLKEDVCFFNFVDCGKFKQEFIDELSIVILCFIKKEFQDCLGGKILFGLVM